MDRTTGDGGRSLTTCCEATSVLADGLPRNFCGCSSVGRARSRHESWVIGATSSRLVIRSTSGVSFHSVAARHGVGGAGCARPLARPRAARHHIRRDARVWAQPKWISIALVAQQAEQPPCKRQAARSNRRRGRQLVESRSSRRLRTLDFQSGDAGSNPARDASTQEPSSSSRFGGGKRPRT